MKRIISALIIVALVFSLSSCEEEPSPLKVMIELRRLLSLDSVIYSTESEEHEDGYIREGLIERIYRTDKPITAALALILSARPENTSECALFQTDLDSEMRLIDEAIEERIRLLGTDPESILIIRKGNLIFYSTFPDREFLRECFYRALSSSRG